NRVDVTVEVDRHDDLLNGRQGETRQALQHLLNRFLNRGDGSRYHLQLEVNDFWQQREAELTALAHRLADDAAGRNAEVVSDYLNSQERRIVHMTLKEDGRVKTFSLGSGAVKRVAVAPAGFPERSEEDPSCAAPRSFGRPARPPRAGRLVFTGELPCSRSTTRSPRSPPRLGPAGSPCCA